MQKTTLALFIIIFSMINRPALSQKGAPQPNLAPPVQVVDEDSLWRIRGERLTATIRTADLQMTVKTPTAVWRFAPSMNDDLVLQKGARWFLDLLAAQNIEFSPYSTGFSKGVKIELSRFGEELDLVLQLFVVLERESNDLVCRIVPIEDKTALLECRWPKPLLPESFDFTVVPFMQGMLLPREWPQGVRLYDRMSYSRGLYMPWWGHLQGEAAMLTLLETPVDAGCHFRHPPHGPTVISPLWLHSLGRFRYSRQVRYCFLDKGGYVDLAKRYRRQVMEKGAFVSLDEKIARTPAVAKLIGSPILHTSILSHIVEGSSYYDKEHPERNHRLTTFAERAAQIKRLRQRGVDRLYIHVDGWGYRGYDNLHPDYLPPSPEAGGWDGMKSFVEACQNAGYLLALHDQYRDYYLDALSYDDKHALVHQDGRRPFESTWAGGPQSILCPSLAPGFVYRNHAALRDHGIRVDGSYLDVFAVVPPDECYAPEHPATRRECLDYRAHCFTIIKRLEGITSSEEPVDWAIPYLDLVHHGPYALQPNPGGGPAMGIPIPLFNLVYHDAIILPWSIGRDKGGWGIPDDDSGFLHGLLNAGIPYISINPDEQEMDKVKRLSALHARVGALEMVRHEFLDSTYRRQRSTFADGATVSVDFDAGTFTIEP